MTFQYVSVEEAIKRSGVRMVVVGGVPSPWGEAAKGILHVKSIDWAAVRLVYDSEPLKEWAGQRSAPILMYNNDRPRAGWAEILLLSEHLAPDPSLLPKDAADRAVAFGLAHEICGEQGLAWSRRLQLIHAGLKRGRLSRARVHVSQQEIRLRPASGCKCLKARGRRAAHADVAIKGTTAGGKPLLHGRRIDRSRHLQCHLHGDVCAAATRAMPDGLADARRVSVARPTDRSRLGPNLAPASRHDLC